MSNFIELMKVLVDAYNKGAIKEFFISDKVLEYKIGNTWYMTNASNQAGLCYSEHIQKIEDTIREYLEFVIENELDIYRITVGAEITLANGEVVTVISYSDFADKRLIYVSYNNEAYNLPYLALIGARVLQ